MLVGRTHPGASRKIGVGFKIFGSSRQATIGGKLRLMSLVEEKMRGFFTKTGVKDEYMDMRGTRYEGATP